MSIRLESLSRSFHSKRVLHSTSLNTPDRGLVILTGPNGSGKTTLLRILSTLLLPSSGEAWLNGSSVLRDASAVRAHIGFVSSTEGGFFPRLTGLENLLLFGNMRGLPTQAIGQSLARLRGGLNLEEVLKTPFMIASSGMKQTLALALALLHGPDILLLDEPTKNLDRDSASRLRKFIAQLSKEKLVVMSTHLPEDGLGARQTLEIKEGRLNDVG